MQIQWKLKLKIGDGYTVKDLTEPNCFVIKLRMKSFGQKKTNVEQPTFNQRSMNVEKN